MITFSNCPGGETTMMHTFEAYLRAAKQDYPGISFIARAIGHNASCTTVLMCSGVFAEVHVDVNATFMIHNVSMCYKESAKAQKLELLRKQSLQTEQKIIEYYSRKSTANGKPRSSVEWQKLLDDGEESDVLSAQQWFDLGLCDKVIDDSSAALPFADKLDD